MRQTTIITNIISLLILSCERDELSIRDPFIIVGEITASKYFDYNPDLIFNSESDSFDFNFDGKNDIEFVEDNVFIDCEIGYCPPDSICDCWPTIYTDYSINLAADLEIAINQDSTIYEFELYDTISNQNVWVKESKYPIYRWSPYNQYDFGDKDRIIGLRIIIKPDTLYSWINLAIVNHNFIVKEALIQK